MLASRGIRPARKRLGGALAGRRSVGITAGASAPEHLVQGVVAALGRLRPTRLRRLAGTVEDLRFRLPSELADPEPAARSA